MYSTTPPRITTRPFAHLAALQAGTHPLGHSPTRSSSKNRRVTEPTQEQYNRQAVADYVAAMINVDLRAALTLMDRLGPTSYDEVAMVLGVSVDLLLVRLKHHFGSRLPVLD